MTFSILEIVSLELISGLLILASGCLTLVLLLEPKKAVKEADVNEEE